MPLYQYQVNGDVVQSRTNRWNDFDYVHRLGYRRRHGHCVGLVGIEIELGSRLIA